MFGVSREAAEKRMNTLQKAYGWNERRRSRDDDFSLGDCIIERFCAFIDSVAPLKHSYTYSFEREYDMEMERQGWQ